MNDFIKKMLGYGAELDKSTDAMHISMIINDAEILYKKHIAELNLLTIPDINNSDNGALVCECETPEPMEYFPMCCELCGRFLPDKQTDC